MLAPAWIRRTLDGLEAQLVGERSRRETAERRDRTLRDQIAKEAEAQQHLRVELDDALHQVEQFKELLSAEGAARSSADARVMELTRELATGEIGNSLLRRAIKRLKTGFMPWSEGFLNCRTLSRFDPSRWKEPLDEPATKIASMARRL